jgi:uncharacterized membrane protein
LKSARGPDIQALKARLDEALRPERTAPAPSAPPAAPVEATTTPARDDTPAVVASAAPIATAPRPRLQDRLAGATARLRTGLPRLPSRRTEPATPSNASDDVAPSGRSAVAPVMATASVDVAPPVVTPTQRTTRTEYARRAAAAERRRPLLSLSLLATALTAGGVLHILTTFAIPALNTGSAYDRLRWNLEPNAMRVFPADANGQTPLPFLTADMRYAMCRYDLTQGAVQISATLPDIGWSLALYTPQGDNFYAVPGLDGRQVTAAFTLNTASDRLLLPMPGVRRADTDANQVTSPQREGLVVIRAPNRGAAYQPILEDALRRATCRPAPRR